MSTSSRRWAATLLLLLTTTAEALLPTTTETTTPSQRLRPLRSSVAAVEEETTAAAGTQRKETMLRIRDLEAKVIEADKAILKGLNLEVKRGEIHAIMGPNGSGKSTLSKVLARHPSYEVTGGSVEFDGRDLVAMDPIEASQAGVFLAFQYPVELPGVGNTDFLRLMLNEKRKADGLEELDPLAFLAVAYEKCKLVEMDTDFLNRDVNSGFSGGEKKRNEILQMAMLEPQLGILDETDSGLDIDALRTISDGINQLHSPDNAFVLITHYQRLLDYVKPDFVHIMSDGNIVKTGGPELARELEKYGYADAAKDAPPS